MTSRAERADRADRAAVVRTVRRRAIYTPHADPVELSVVIPCLNEAETVARCVASALRGLAAHGIAGEVLVADNGSTDGSQEIAAAAGARVVPVAARGYGSALLGGIAAARGRWVLMGDADDSYDLGGAAALRREAARGRATSCRAAACRRAAGASRRARCRSCTAGGATRCSAAWRARGSARRSTTSTAGCARSAASSSPSSICAARGWSSRPR